MRRHAESHRVANDIRGADWRYIGVNRRRNGRGNNGHLRHAARNRTGQIRDDDLIIAGLGNGRRR